MGSEQGAIAMCPNTNPSLELLHCTGGMSVMREICGLAAVIPKPAIAAKVSLCMLG